MTKSPSANTLSDPAALKFGLFVKTHELQQIVQSLREVMLLPLAEREEWVDEHQDLLNDMMDSFLDDSLLVMDGMHLDQEATNLSIELLMNLREVMNTVQTILQDSRTLKG